MAYKRPLFCSASPVCRCQNGGQCLSNNTVCMCSAEFTGLLCETTILSVSTLLALATTLDSNGKKT